MSNKPYFAVGFSPDELVDISDSLRELNIKYDSLFSIEAIDDRESFKSGEIITSSGCVVEIQEIELFRAKIVHKESGRATLGLAGTCENPKPRDCEWQPSDLEQRYVKLDGKRKTHKIMSVAHYMHQVRLTEKEYPYDESHHFIFGSYDSDSDVLVVTKEVTISPES